MYRRDPITTTPRLIAPGRAARLSAPPRGCPFCPGNEHTTPVATGTRPRRAMTPTDASWSARSFANLFPLTTPHEVLVPTPNHATSWRDLSLPELQDGLALLLERRRELLVPERYVHAFVNDGAAAGASLEHVHAQLVVVDRGAHSDQLVAGVCDAATCALCDLLSTEDELLVERGNHFSILAHPVPRIGGGLLLVPNAHDTNPSDEHLGELAEFILRMWAAIDPEIDANMWLVADEHRSAHWYVELQPRTANLAGVELALGLSVSAANAAATAESARERLAMRR